MAYYPIKDLGKLGVIADLSPTDIPPNAFTDAINARFVGSQVTKFGGNKPVTFKGEEDQVVPFVIQPMPFDNQFDHPFNLLGTTDGIYLLEDNTWRNASYWEPVGSGFTASCDVSVHPLMTSLALNTHQENVKMGQSLDLEVTLLPDGVRKVDVDWVLDIAAAGTLVVDPDNKLKATFTANTSQSVQATINVYNPDHTLNDFCVITVVPNVDGIQFNKTTYSIRRGDSEDITITLLPTDPVGFAMGDVTWLSSDSTIFTVTPDGTDIKKAKIDTLDKTGFATLTAYLTGNPSIRSSVGVSITPGITGITLDKPYIEDLPGTDVTLTVKYNPTNPPNKKIIWSDISGLNHITIAPSSDTTSAVVSLHTLGSGTVQAMTEDGGLIALCSVYVVQQKTINTGSTINSTIPTGRSAFVQSDALDDVITGYASLNLFDDAPVMSTMALAAAPMAVTGVTLDKTSLDIDQGDKVTITATPTFTGNPSNVIYRWTTNKDGVITHDETDQATFTLYGLGKGLVKVTCHVWDTTQKLFNVSERTPWYTTVVANCAVFTEPNFPPLVKEFADEYFKILPGWGEQTVVDAAGNYKVDDRDWTCERVRAFNNRLFALNMKETEENGVIRHYPQRIRWSNFASENKAPKLWDDLADLRDPEDNNNAEGTLKALVNGYAGYIDLADTQGDLMDIFPLKDYLFAYTEFETYVGTPTMNAYQPMTFKKLFNDSGILAPGCVCEIEGGQFVVTQNDIILHNGATKRSIATSIVKDKIIREINTINPAATKVYLHSDKKEVWIMYVPPGMPKDTWYCSKAAIWNYEYETWSFYELPHLYCIALSDPPNLEKSALWNDYAPTGKLPMTWEDVAKLRTPWQKNFQNFRRRITIGGSRMKGLYQLDTGAYSWTSVNNDDTFTPKEHPLRMEVTRQGIDFDNATEEWRQKHVNNFHIQINGQGTMMVEAGGTQYSNELGHEHNLREYIAGRTRRLSVRLNHPYLYYRIIDEDPDSTLFINSVIIEYVVGGMR